MFCLELVFILRQCWYDKYIIYYINWPDERRLIHICTQPPVNLCIVVNACGIIWLSSWSNESIRAQTHSHPNNELANLAKAVKSRNHGIGKFRERFSRVHLESGGLINVDHIFFSLLWPSSHVVISFKNYENRQQQRFFCAVDKKKRHKINTKSNQTVTKRRQRRRRRWKRNQTCLELEWHQAIKSIPLSFLHTTPRYQCLFSCFSFDNRIFGVCDSAQARQNEKNKTSRCEFAQWINVVGCCCCCCCWYTHGSLLYLIAYTKERKESYNTTAAISPSPSAAAATPIASMLFYLLHGIDRYKT